MKILYRKQQLCFKLQGHRITYNLKSGSLYIDDSWFDFYQDQDCKRFRELFKKTFNISLKHFGCKRTAHLAYYIDNCLVKKRGHILNDYFVVIQIGTYKKEILKVKLKLDDEDQLKFLEKALAKKESDLSKTYEKITDFQAKITDFQTKISAAENTANSIQDEIALLRQRIKGLAQESMVI